MIRRLFIFFVLTVSTGFALAFDFPISPSPGGSLFVSLGYLRASLMDISAIDQSFRAAFAGTFPSESFSAGLSLNGFESGSFRAGALEPLLSQFPASMARDVLSPMAMTTFDATTLRDDLPPSMVDVARSHPVGSAVTLHYGASVGYRPVMESAGLAEPAMVKTLMEASLLYPQALSGQGSLGLDVALSKHVTFVFAGMGRFGGLSSSRGAYLSVTGPDGSTLNFGGMELSLAYYDAMLSGREAGASSLSMLGDKSRRSAFCLSDYSVAGGIRFTF